MAVLLPRPRSANRHALLLDYTPGPAQLAWVLCTTLSISSSRYLLLDLGLHYPFCIHLLQLHAALLVTVLRPARFRKGMETVRSRSLSRGQFLRALLRSVLISLSGTLAMQAIMHFPNLATIVMLPVRHPLNGKAYIQYG
jgi:hypothetical protein